MKDQKKLDLTRGPLFLPILKFALPLMASGMLQSAYNAANSIIVSRGSGDALAMEAIMSTTTLVNLIINVFIALTAGSGVVIAQYIGAGDVDKVKRSVHTSVAFSVIGGIAVSILGILVSRPALVLMGTKPEILDSATLYIRIIFAGIPGLSVYNFASTVLRSKGNSSLPLIILGISGGLNVALGSLFVLAFDLGVAGVAIATITSQYLSAAAVVVSLILSNDYTKLHFRKLKINGEVLVKMLKIGVPSAVNVAFFCVANVVMQSSVNSFTIAEVGGYGISNNVEGFVYAAVYSYLSVAVTFIGQNYGARKPERVKKSLYYICAQCATIGIVLGAVFLIFGRQLGMLFIDASLPENTAPVIDAKLDAAMVRMSIVLPTYFLCGLQDSLSGYLRGLGKSVPPTVASLVGVFAFRMLFVALLFPTKFFHTPFWLYMTWPISWVIVIGAEVVMAILSFRELRQMEKENKENEEVAVA